MRNLLVFALASALAWGAATALGANKDWDNGAGDGLWSSAANWNPDGVPGLGGVTDSVFITGATKTITLDYDAPAVAEFDLARGSSTDGTITVNQTAGTLQVNSWISLGQYRGGTATGILNMSGSSVLNATHTSGGQTVIGNGVFGSGTLPAVGALTLSDTAQFNQTANEIRVGGETNASVGIGTITLNGSSQLKLAGGNFLLGNGNNAAGSKGTLNVHDSAIVTLGAQMQVGFNCAGYVYQDGGTVSGANWVSIGRFAGVTGAYNISGGAFSQTNTGCALIVGEEGSGTLNLGPGGTVNAVRLWVGHTGNSVGTVSQTDGILAVSGGDSMIGGSAAAGTNATGTYTLGGGTASFAGNFQIGAYGKGTLTLTGGALNHTAGYAVLGRYPAGIGTLNISDGTFNDSVNTLIVAEQGRGTVNLSGSGILNANQLWLGHANNSAGAIYQTGGTLSVTSGASTEHFSISHAAGSYGYYKMTDGTLNASEVGVGGAAGGNAVLDMAGGTFTPYNWLTIGRGANQVAVVNVSAGSLNAPSLSNNAITANWGAGDTSVITLSGTGVLDAANGFNNRMLNLNNTAGSTGILNLRTGGTVVANSIGATAAGTTLVNFNGGTLRAASGTANAAAFLQGLSGAYLYANGAIVDTNGENVTINQALSAPAGDGLSGIAVATGGSGYIAPPIVQITGGGGTGASAIAVLTGGVVTGIEITNPGAGYTAAPTVALVGGGPTTAATLGAPTLAPNSSGGLSKQGAGTLTLTGANTYTGATSVNAGALYVNGSLSAAGAVSVADGATLGGGGSAGAVTVATGAMGGTIEPGQAGAGALSLGGLTFSGLGVVNVSNPGSYAASPAIALANDLRTNGADTVTINIGGMVPSAGVYKLIGYGTISGTGFDAFHLGVTPGGLGERPRGYALVSGTGSVDLRVTAPDNNILWTGKASTAWDTTVRLPGATNWKYVSSGNPTDFYSMDLVTFDDSAPLKTVDISGADVTPAGVTFNNTTGNDYTLQGSNAIAGPTALTKSGDGTLVIGNVNTYTGGTTINGGTVLYGAADALPAAGAVHVNGASAVLDLSGTVSSTGALTLTDGTIQNGTLLAASCSVKNGSISVGLAGSGSLTKDTSGTVTLSGAITYTGTTTINAGTLTLSGISTAGGALLARSGTIVVPTGGAFSTTSFVSVGQLSGDKGLMAVTGQLTVDTDLNVSDTTGSAGTLTVQDGALLSARNLYVGKTGTAIGVLNMTGGTLQRNIADSEWRIGGAGGAADVNAQGTFNLSGGAVSLGTSNFQVGAFGKGWLNMSGGTVSVTYWPCVGRFTGGVGYAHVSGGTFFQGGAGQRFIVAELGTGELTVSGSGTMDLTGGLRVGLAAGGNGTVNLAAGGTISTSVIDDTGGTSKFNFNGGVLKAAADNPTFFQGLDAAHVNAGGAIIDTNGRNITINQPLLAAPANGLTGVTAVVGGSGYTSPPVVTVTGDGTGATAYATTNAAGAVTGIVIGNPGSGYTTAAFTINPAPGAAGSGASATPVIAPNTGGGLTKQGDGTLTLGGANTYAGPTTIAAGTLRLSAPPPLAHRWSFNSDLNDSVGGSNATIQGGTINAATLAATQVTLAGGAKADSQYVSLGTNILPASSPVTIELWATQNQVQNWSRIFDFGQDTNNYLMMSWTQGTNLASDRVSFKEGGGGESLIDNRNAPYALGTEYHIAMVVTPGGGAGGLTRVEVYTAPAANGTIGASKGYVDTTYTLASLPQVNMWLGQSQYGDNTASASYNEVRIWDGAVSLAYLDALQQSGPDTIDLSSVGILPNTPVNVAAGATLDLNGSSATIASLSDVSGAGGTVSNSAPGNVALTLDPVSGSSTFTGTIEDVGGALSLTLSGASGATQVLRGDNTYRGGTNVTGGTLQIGSAGALPAGGSLTIGSGGTVVLSSGLSVGAGAAHAATPVPEPGTLALLAVATVGLICAARRRFCGMA